MKMIQGLFFASFIAILLAMLFSFLPTVDLQVVENGLANSDNEQPVFQNSKPVHLERNEVVSFLKGIPLHYPYKQVKLENNDMFIDVQVNHKDYFNPDEVYLDAYTLVSTLMDQTENINQVFIRFILLGDEHHKLLLAITAERNEGLLEGLTEQSVPLNIPLFLKENTKVVYGIAWGE